MTTQTDKDFQNVQRLFNKVGKADWIRRPFQEFGVDVRSEVSPYPPQRSPTYQRTRHLQRSWYDRVSPNSVEVGNTADYAGYVHSTGRQAWFHAETGWALFEQGIAKAMAQMNKTVTANFNKLVRKHAKR